MINLTINEFDVSGFIVGYEPTIKDVDDADNSYMTFDGKNHRARIRQKTI